MATPMKEDAPPDSRGSQENWNGTNEPSEGMRDVQDLEPSADGEHETNGSAPANGEGDNDGRTVEEAKEEYRSEATAHEAGGKTGSNRDYRDRQVKPNKVYIGGLPENTRQEDLRSCFGKIGEIVNIELKLGFGFVEFESKEAAEESVAKYNEGTFMGNKIRVELSRGGSRAQKAQSELGGVCYNCHEKGHWAKECRNPPRTAGAPRRAAAYSSHNSEHGDRSFSSREYPPKDYAQYPREGDYGRYPAARGETRYSYDYPAQAAPPPPSGREYRRAPSPPPRDYRDYPPPRRDYEDYRSRAPAPAPVPAPAPPSRAYYPPEVPASYPPRGYDSAPPPRDYVDRGSDRRPPPDRYAQYPPSSRPRTPPGPPPREYERPPPRDYPPPDYRGRQTPPLPSSTGSRYNDYPSSRNVDQRYRRRSQSPPPRNGYRGGYANDQVDPGYAPYGASSAPYSANGYVGASGPPPRRERDYPPPAHRGAPDVAAYSRRG